MPDNTTQTTPNPIPLGSKPTIPPPEPPPEKPDSPSQPGLETPQPSPVPSEPTVISTISPAPPDKKMPPKLILGIIIIFFLLASIPAAVFLVGQSQEIREKAVGEGQLVCMPIDDTGNLTNEKYQYNRIKVINNTPQQVALWIQRNLCPYQGIMPSLGYRCDQYLERFGDNLSPGQEKIYSIDVPACQIGQLDVAQDDQAMGTYTPDCYNTVDQRIWEGGIAFTIKTNPQCVPTQCIIAGWRFTPTSPLPNQSVKVEIFGASSEVGWGNVILKRDGVNLNASFTVEPPPAGSPPGTTAYWWTTVDSGSAGTHTLEFGINNGAIMCSPTKIYTAVTPTTSPASCNCVQIKAYDANWNAISNLNTIQAGQTVKFAVLGQTTDSQGITKARIRINSGVWQETTNKKPNTNEFYVEYTIPAAGGSFAVEGEVFNPTLGWK